MGRIRWTPEAESWLREIHDFIALDNPTAARRTVRGIYDKIQSLRRFPELGHRYRDTPGGPIRTLLYGHYRIAYLIGPEQSIEVLGIYHGKLDLERHLP